MNFQISPAIQHTNRILLADFSFGIAFMMVPNAASAASSMGYPNAPVEIAGNAIDSILCSSAIPLIF